MKIKELVELACEKSPTFAAKVQWYRARKRPRETIDLEWLMPLLEDALGKEFVENAAQEEIERQEAIAAQEIDDVVDSMIDQPIFTIPEDGTYEVTIGPS